MATLTSIKDLKIGDKIYLLEYKIFAKITEIMMEASKYILILDSKIALKDLKEDDKIYVYTNSKTTR